MSLAAFAVRIATVRALQACLPAPIVVVDSPQDAIALLDAQTPTPVVAIYSGHIETQIEGRAILLGDPRVTLSIQFMLPERFAFPTGPNSSISIDTRRQGASIALDVLWRKAARALDGSQEPWACLWREFVLATPRIFDNSYLIEQAQVRVIAREIAIECETLQEPIPGPDDPPRAWRYLLAAMRADTNGDGLSALADWLEAEIRGQDTRLWVAQAAALGVTREELTAIGLGPVDPAISEDAVPIEQIDLQDAQQDDEDSATIVAEGSILPAELPAKDGNQ